MGPIVGSLLSAALLVSCSGGGAHVELIPDGSTTKPFVDVKVGDCLTESSISSKTDTGVLVYPCPNQKAPYELATIGPSDRGCPDGNLDTTGYATITETQAKSRLHPDPPKLVYCFALNLVPNSCYLKRQNYLGSSACLLSVEDRRKYPNLYSINPIRAVSQIDGNPAAQCEEGQEKYSFPKPQRVICTADVPQPPI